MPIRSFKSSSSHLPRKTLLLADTLQSSSPPLLRTSTSTTFTKTLSSWVNFTLIQKVSSCSLRTQVWESRKLDNSIRLFRNSALFLTPQSDSSRCSLKTRDSCSSRTLLTSMWSSTNNSTKRKRSQLSQPPSWPLNKKDKSCKHWRQIPTTKARSSF